MSRNVDKMRNKVRGKGKGSSPNSRKGLSLKKGRGNAARTFSTWDFLRAIENAPRGRPVDE